MGFPQLHLFPPFSFTLSYPFFLHIYHNHIFIQQLTQTQTQTPFPFIISSHSIVWFVNFHFFFFLGNQSSTSTINTYNPPQLLLLFLTHSQSLYFFCIYIISFISIPISISN
ncbi:predicted protein [Candida albicans WO-1]|uniref:Uncharacterized protein n=1 Tax=Candida albicans (strain WO-1) TaxID=294748 RepID=C4YJF1_CANAW|nr:predicted protein [Candida albicans WO-1]